eukprot:2239166-Karenia_brevis.AAC.1
MSGLRVKVKKCAIVPLWKFSKISCAKLLKEYVPGWAEMSITGCAKYLGFWLGPQTDELVWKDPVKKWKDKAELARTLGVGLFNTIKFYNATAVSALAFVSQLSWRPENLRKEEYEVLQRLTCGPRNALSFGLLTHLECVGMPTSCISIDAMNLSSLCRVATTTSRVWLEEKTKYDVYRTTSENATLLDTCYVKNGLFDTPAIVDTLSSALTGGFLPYTKSHEFQRILADVTSYTTQLNLQKELRTAIMKNIDVFNLHGFLERRFVRLRREWQYLPCVSTLADRATLLAQQHLASLPPCVTASVVKTWCNGW